METKYGVYFGDLHSHNSVGLAQGSLERSFDIAREHLDFHAFMGHSQWHDMPRMPQDKQKKWADGFAVHTARWPEVMEMNRETYEPGKFVTFNGYEWHSSDCGDYCIIFPGDEAELFFVDSVEELAEKGRGYGAILCPHHAAYAKFWRGIVWDRMPSYACPIAETFSEHGNCFDDRGLEPMIRHSLGGRPTKGTVLWALLHGHRFGLVGGTFNVLIFLLLLPGHHQGLVIGQIHGGESQQDNDDGKHQYHRQCHAALIFQVLVHGFPPSKKMTLFILGYSQCFADVASVSRPRIDFCASL
mgnify:CR=1 FL=1